LSRYFITWCRSLSWEDGQDLAEYALLVALVAVALVLIISGLAGVMSGVFNTMRNGLADAAANSIQP
jgi:Flp pilus assembly pilin Flp